MLNPFFQQGTRGEQNLIQDLINEQLKIYGVEVYYIPRQYVNKNTIIREVIESKFENAYPIEAYVDTYDGYQGLGTLMSKFGIQEMDDLVLILSKERYESYITPLIKNLPNIELATRPKEGDLIYFPLGDRLFEIKYVEHEKPFYQLQKNYVYELRCELFRAEDEILDTSVEEIDDNLIDRRYIQSLTLVGVSSVATAIAGFVSGALRSVTITNRGVDYTSAPRVAISSAPAGGVTAIGIASMFGALTDCEGLTSDSKVQAVEIINPGIGYTVAPGIVFIGGGGSGAAATTVLSDNGAVGVVTITSGGSGYTTAPTITFSVPGGATATASTTAGGVGTIDAITITNPGIYYTTAPTVTISGPIGGGTTAEATATIGAAGTVTTITLTNAGAGYTSDPTVTISNLIGEKDPDEVIVPTGVAYISSAGIVTSIRITNAGLGYSSAPTVTVSSPPVGLGTTSKTFVFNEIVTGSISGTTARVNDWDGTTNILEVYKVDGTFVVGENITGSESGAVSQLRSLDTDDLVDTYAENDIIESEADDIIDFTEKNPFGIP